MRAEHFSLSSHELAGCLGLSVLLPDLTHLQLRDRGSSAVLETGVVGLVFWLPVEAGEGPDGNNGENDDRDTDHHTRYDVDGWTER